MPTGYTAGVQSGEIKKFDEFAMRCARNFGALIMMREEPMDAPIPNEFQPSSYHLEAKAKAERRLAELVAMDEDRCRDEALARFQEQVKVYEERKAEKALEETRYRTMLMEVRAWTPPTPDHQGLKDFMVQQLEESIEHDCSTKYMTEPVLFPGREWHVNQVAAVQHEVQYHTKELIEEEKRARTRTEWVKSLRLSLQAGSAGRVPA